LLLQTWLSQAFDASSEAEQQAFIALLDWPDDKLSYLLLGVNLADDTEINALARKIRQLSAAQS
jgi:succinate dehydrogenase flavin-adding protein (antitoxin of CptAB toxin-antitoxin module)